MRKIFNLWCHLLCLQFFTWQVLFGCATGEKQDVVSNSDLSAEFSEQVFFIPSKIDKEIKLEMTLFKSATSKV